VYLLRLLGEPRLTDGADRSLPVGRVAASLLALLGRSPDRCVGRERVAALLWPDAEPGAGRRALRQLVFRIRADAPSAIEGSRQELRLGSSVDVDTDRFAQAIREGRLDDAADMYGPFLDGFVLPGCGAFEQWVDGERTLLRRSAADAFERLAEQATTRGDWAAARSAAARWLAAEPYSESAAACLVAATARAVGRTAALGTWDRFRQRLHDELGTEPSPALEQLAQRLRADPGIIEGPLHEPRAPEQGGVAELPFVGRDEEYALLSGCWRRVREGRRHLVLLRGEPGIGKTRLAAELAQWAGSMGATVLAARAWEVEAPVPYATLAGALRDALRARGLAGAEERTLSELGRIVPEYRTRFPRTAPPADGTFETGSLRIMEAVRDLLESLAFEAPVLLMVDDLPWADQATIANLQYSWRTLPDLPLLILATARGTSAAELRGAGGFVAAAMREPDACTVIEVGPLARSAIESLSRHAAGSSLRSDARELELRSGGNPLFLGELIRSAGDGGDVDTPSETIRFVVRDRVAALEEVARVLLHAAAVLGRQFPLPDAVGVAGLDAPAAAAAIDLLVARRLIRQVSYGYDFVHDVVRETVLAELGPATRRLLHARAFEYLRAGGTDPALTRVERASALAHHAAAADMRPEAHGWHMHAARAAIALFAPTEADRALARALEFADDDAQRCEVWTAIAELARVRSDFRSAAYAFRRAFETSGNADERLHLRLRMLHMGVCAGLFSVDDVESLAGALREEAGHSGTALLGDLLFIEADSATRAGDLERACERAEAALRAHRSAGAPQPLVRTLLLNASVRARSGRTGALELLREAEQIARGHDLGTELSDVRVEIATELSRLGRWDEALAGFSRVVDDATVSGDFGNVPIARLNSADLHVRRGEWDAARSEIAELENICARFHFPHVAAATRLNGALLEWMRGNPAEAMRLACDARSAADATGLPAVAVAAAALEALCLLEHGNPDAAAAALDGEGSGGVVQHATWSDDAELVTVASARLLASRGDRDAAQAMLARAHAVAREPYAAALLALEHAELLADCDTAAAARLARAALKDAEHLGAVPLAQRARGLARLGASVSSGCAAPLDISS
jgi:DNA-binding SARP family transcriptional activator/tetratricopeptide (TPR) repeat protein